jgi:purine-binding chemotaxis protein CheW
VSDLYVIFKVAEAEYMLAASDVALMESFVGATRVPATQKHVVGVVQIRGQVVPVIDLRVRFGLPPREPTIDSRVVVVLHQGRSIGLLVDMAREVIKLTPEQFRPPPEIVSDQSAGMVMSVVQAGPRLVMLIDFGKVIGEEVVHGE